MNFIKKFIGSSPTDEVVSIPSGKLFLTRSPNSPKGEIECLYNDAFASIRKTTSPFYYQLCVTRVYEEGEIDAHGDGGFGDSDSDDEYSEEEPSRSVSDHNIRSYNNKDEWQFTITEDIEIYFYDKRDGGKALTWKDLNGDLGDKFEFIVDEEIKYSKVEEFQDALFRCLYESKYHMSSISATRESLKEFAHKPDVNFFNLSSIDRSKLLQYADLDRDDDDADEDEEDEENSSGDEFHDADANLPVRHSEPNSVHTNKGRDKSVSAAKSVSLLKGRDGLETSRKTAPLLGGSKVSENKDTLSSSKFYDTSSFDLHLFDGDSGIFKLYETSPDALASICSIGDWDYTLSIKTKDKISFTTVIDRNMSPTFNYDFNSFIFNYFTVSPDGEASAFSWLLKFKSPNELSELQSIFMKAMWESLNKTKWGQTSGGDKKYIVDAFSKMSVKDDDPEKKEVEEMIDDDVEMVDIEQEEEDHKNEGSAFRRITKESKLRDEDSEDDDEPTVSKWKSNRTKNSNMSVAIAGDRSYVVRGNELGVFGNEDKNLALKTTIDNVKDLKGTEFVPEKMMLHQRDHSLIMSNSRLNNEKLYKMDLNRGTIVEEWDVKKNLPIVSFGPNSKYSQLTDEQTFTGLSNNNLFQIDPRLPGFKIVDDKTHKAYKSKDNAFSTLATTEQGFLAVGSSKGDIRLYDKLGLNAKSALPSLGEAVFGLDVSGDGRWLLATCKSYLLLIDTKIGKSQKNHGSLGFQKFFDADKKPTPRRLSLKAEHAAFILQQTHKSTLNFTKAHFNTGHASKETTIVTSTGPYLVTWSLKKVLKGEDEPYLVRKYNDQIIADDFKFGSNREVVLAMEDDVSLVNRSSLRKASNTLYRH